MLAKCSVVWIFTSVILISASATDLSQVGGEARIYAPGGHPLQAGEFPFLVLLEIVSDKENATCSGSIPSPSTVLSAAHCHVGKITAYAGTVSKNEKQLMDAELQVRSVKHVAKPEEPKIYDIMICHVNESWVWSKSVGPISLHLSEMRLQPSFVATCQVMGFGETAPDGGAGVAHMMDQLIGSGSQCMDVHALFFFISFYMCSVNVEDKTACSGDSGGPAVCNGQQWGIVMGVPHNATCLVPKDANVYVYIAYFRRWILANIEDLPSSADTIHRLSMKISMIRALLYPPLWLSLLMTVVTLY